MRIAFINKTGGIMTVDESRKDEYLDAGYILASNVIDSTATELVDKPAEKKPSTRRKKA